MITPEVQHPEHFVLAARDELWMRGRLVEARLTHGEALQHGDRIEASDGRDDELVRCCDEAIDAARSLLSSLQDARVRIVVRAAQEDGQATSETTMTIAAGGLSLVTTPDHALADDQLLRSLAGRNPVAPVRSLPILWQNGSAAVLLHEAIGHAVEEGAEAVSWPAWLSVATPLASRRATFRDVPMARMTQLIARQEGAPFELPQQRVDVQLIAGGAYDPLTDIVTIDVAASTCGAFTVRRTRAEIAASLIGATGEPIRYPGVICSREGQELYVASHAPVMLTGPLT